VFVHCAAAFDQVTISDVDAATWRHVQAVNVESALWLVQAFAPGMAERRFGRIVFVTSDTFWAPPAPVLLAYIASKGALLGIMRTLAAPSAPTASPCPRWHQASPTPRPPAP
jgi:Dehydrogenases with different specificities (related to short-chain alcohol dehydrogenases)